MTSKVHTLTFLGIETIEIAVQCYMEATFPSFTIVGLADKTIAESKERVRAALSSIGIALPSKKIIVNLAPADLFKEGSHFDLAIACSLLVKLGVIAQDVLEQYCVLGELSLDGNIMSVPGVLPAAIGAMASNKGIICPFANGKEAAWSANESIIAPTSLLSLINHFNGKQILAKPLLEDIKEPIKENIYQIKGQLIAKRAIEIAASGSHNIIMSGPPGSGKTLLAKYLSNILPSMSVQEILECSIMYSIAGKLSNGELQIERPFRAPHHSCSMPAMVGGGIGKKITPGEISLAHNGVLFLDELPEFPRIVLDSLRQPIESGKILVSRVYNHVNYPARFQLVAAMNPCRCGYLDDLDRNCHRAPKCAMDYQAKISGPILDRIDLNIEVPALKAYDITINDDRDSKKVIKRVEEVRKIQQLRYHQYGIKTNNQIDGDLIALFATPSVEAKSILNDAVDKFKLSMRSYNRILRVARTIADMENEKKIEKHHISEALSYRKSLIRGSN